MRVILSKRKLILSFLILSTVLLLYGGCGKEKKNDIIKKDEIKDSNLCDQCKAMTKEKCSKTNYCVQKCDCSQATGKKKDEKVVCKKIIHNGTTKTHCASNATVVDGNTCTTDNDCEHSQQCKTLTDNETNTSISVCISFDCPENQTQYEHTCVPVIEVIGIVCLNNTDCEDHQNCGPHPDVNQTVCKDLSCPPNQAPRNHTCVTTLGLPCTLDIQCASDENCIDSGTGTTTCTKLNCQPGQVIENHKCVTPGNTT